ISAPLAFQAGARATLVGHSERRHVFGETDEDTRRKVAAALAGGLAPMLCVGETLAERDAGHTLAVVVRQLAGALSSLDGPTLSRLIVAYEPVWAIGTGRNATPRDAATVHREIRAWLTGRGAGAPRVLYGGRVNAKNVAVLLQAGSCGGYAALGGAAVTEEFMGCRQATKLLTRITWWCAGIFLSVSLILAVMSSNSAAPRSVLEGNVPAPAPVQPTPLPLPTTPPQGAPQPSTKTPPPHR